MQALCDAYIDFYVGGSGFSKQEKDGLGREERRKLDSAPKISSRTPEPARVKSVSLR
jgi:hypothetical protein